MKPPGWAGLVDAHAQVVLQVIRTGSVAIPRTSAHEPMTGSDVEA